MFFAHLPAGYLAARFLLRRTPALGPAHTQRRPLVLAGMAGGVCPDVDLLYAGLIERAPIHHHLYWTHLPIAWAMLAALLWAAGRVLPAPLRRLLWYFWLGAFSHLLLDSVAGDIWWGLPWIDTPFSLVRIAAIHTPWWLNYLLHWTFALELLILFSALRLERRQPVFPRRRWSPA